MEAQKIKTDKKIFLDFFLIKILLKNKIIKHPKIKYKHLTIKLDKKIIYLDFNNKNEFIKLRFKTTNKYLLGCLFFFNKIFQKRPSALSPKWNK